MGGELSVESTPGAGSCFAFTLDLPSAAKPRPAARIETPTVEGAGNRRILIAEDSLVNQVLIRAILDKAGYDFTIVGDGMEALDALAADRYDLVLMDMQMPNLDGLATTARIREREAGSGDRHLPIVALTANAFEEDRRRCLQAGMDDFLAKPFQREALLAVIRRNLDAI